MATVFRNCELSADAICVGGISSALVERQEMSIFRRYTKSPDGLAVRAMSQQETRYPKFIGFKISAAAAWMCSAFCVELGLAALTLAVLGAGVYGTLIALKLTARFSFLLFWLAYSAGAVTSLFGSAFTPLKRRTREFGLAFAAAHLVHLGLVAWIVYIGAAPSRGVFFFFGVAVLWTYLLALFSIPRLHKALGSKNWWVLRVVALNYIGFAFAKDFLGYRQFGSLEYIAGYLPFAALSIIAPLLCFAAFVQRHAGLRKTSDEATSDYRRTSDRSYID